MILIRFCLFFCNTEENSKQDQGQFEKFGIEQKKMLRIGAVDCEEFGQICDKEGVTEFPTYRVYPPFPVPHQDHKSGSDELNTDTLKKMAFKHIGNRVIDITAANHDVFKDDNPGKPKVLLFTDKQKTPIVYRALSTYFDVSLDACRSAFSSKISIELMTLWTFVWCFFDCRKLWNSA